MKMSAASRQTRRAETRRKHHRHFHLRQRRPLHRRAGSGGCSRVGHDRGARPRPTCPCVRAKAGPTKVACANRSWSSGPGTTRPGQCLPQAGGLPDFFPHPPRHGRAAASSAAAPRRHQPRARTPRRGFARAPYFRHYPHYSNQGGSPYGAVRAEGFKLIEWYEDQRLNSTTSKRLGEKHNLADKMPKTAALLTLLHDWRKGLNAQMPTDNPLKASSASLSGTAVSGAKDSTSGTLRYQSRRHLPHVRLLLAE